MIHQNSARSTSSSSSSSCSSTKNAESTTVPNLILYGSPALRSVHRTSMGAIRARPRQKSIKPTTPPPSTPDLHLDLGSLAESDSEDDSRARRTNSDIPVQQDESHCRFQHSNHPSSGASSYHLSHRTNPRPPNKKSYRKMNHKSKVSQILFHDEFQRNSKYNSDTGAAHSLPFSKKNQQKQRFITKKNSSTKSKKVSRTATFDQVSVDNPQEVMCSQYEERTNSNLSVSTSRATTDRSNKVFTQSASYKEEDSFDLSKEIHNFQKELYHQTNASYPQSRSQETTATKALTCGINKKVEDVSFDSGDESYCEVKEQSISQNNVETSADNITTGFASQEERSFQLLNQENKLLEEESENMAISSCETIVNDMYSKGNTVSSNSYELSGLNSQNDFCNYDASTKVIKNEKTSEQWLIPDDKGKKKYSGRCTCSKCNENVGNASAVNLEKNHTKISKNEKNQFSPRENRTNCISMSKYDYNRVVSGVLKEEEQTSSSSQGSLGRERKNSDASWSSYHSSTYTTLSDSTWGCSSDTYESFHSEEVCHRKYSFNTMDELNSNTPRRNPPNSSRSEININAISESISQKNMNKDLEQTRLSSDNECNSDHFQIDVRQPESKSTNIVDTSKDSISDEICPLKNASCRDGADQTRQSSSSGITGSLTVDSSTDIHHSSPECPLQEFISKEKESANKASSSIHEADSEEGAVEEEEEEIASMATSEELCLLCSYNLNACRCLPFPDASSHNNSSISGNNSDNEHAQNLTDSNNSFPSFVRNVCSAPGYNSEYERRTKLLMQRFGCSTAAPDVLLSADEVIEAAMYARQLVHVLEKALDRALSFKMTSVSEIASQSNLRRSQSVPEFFSKRSITNDEYIPNTAEDGSLNTVHIPKNDKWRNSDSNSSKGQDNAEAREGYTSSELFSLYNQKQNDQKIMAKRISVCQEKCYCCGPKLLNISPQELQQQKALLRPVDKKPQAFTVMKDMASILKNVISHRRDIIVPPEDGAYYVSRSVSEWSIDE